MVVSIRPAPWQTLLDTPAPARGRPAGRSERHKPSKAELVEVQMDLWNAVDRDDPRELSRALEAGASLTNRREGRAPLWECVSRGRWALAELLVQSGANVHVKTSSQLSLWAAIAPRDRLDEAERLIGWGLSLAEVPMREFTSERAGMLLTAWFRANPGFEIRLPDRREQYDVEEFRGAMLTAATGPQDLRDLLNAQWGLDAQNPHALALLIFQQHPDGRENVLTDFWSTLIRQDSIEAARTCMAAGWAPPPPDLVPHAHLWNQHLAWTLIHHSAWRLLEWWLSLPEFLQETLDSARLAPQHTWWPSVAYSSSVPLLTRLQALGIDLTVVDKDNGENIAHVVFQSNDLTKSVADWFVQHHPQLLGQADHEGMTPIQACLVKSERPENKKIMAQIQATLLTKSMKNIRAPAASSVKRPRL